MTELKECFQRAANSRFACVQKGLGNGELTGEKSSFFRWLVHCVKCSRSSYRNKLAKDRTSLFQMVLSSQRVAISHDTLSSKITTAINGGARRQYHALMLQLITKIEDDQNLAYGQWQLQDNSDNGLSFRPQTGGSSGIRTWREPPPPSRRAAIEEVIHFSSGGTGIPFKNELVEEEFLLMELENVIDDNMKQAGKLFREKSATASPDPRYLYPEPDITPLSYMTLHNTDERAKDLFSWQRSRGNCRSLLDQLCDFSTTADTINPEMKILLPNDRLLNAFIILDNYVRTHNDRLASEVSQEVLNKLEEELYMGTCSIDLELEKDEGAWLIATYKEHFTAGRREQFSNTGNSLQNSDNHSSMETDNFGGWKS